MQKSFLYLLVATLAYAAMVIPTKLLANVHSLFLVWSAFLVTGILAYIWSYKNGFRYKSLTFDHKKYLLTFGLFHAGCSICLNWSVKLLNASTALLLLYTAPLWIFLYLIIIKKHKIKMSEVAILGVSLIGMILVVNGDVNIKIDGSLFGLFLGLMSGILYCTDFILGEKRPKELTSMASTTMINITGSILLLPGIMYLPTNMSLRDWILVLIFDLLFLLGFVSFLKGVKNIHSFYASVITLMEPIFAGILAYLFLNEKITVLTLIGGALLLGSVFFVEQKGNKLQTENHT